MKARGLILFVSLLLTAQFVAAPARAASSTGLVVPCDTIETVTDPTTGQQIQQFANPCGVDSFVKQFIILSNYGLGLVVVLAVLMFLYGGFQFITAAGRSSKIDEGKRVIVGTVIGIMISMTAFVIVNFTVGAVTGSALESKNLNPFGAIAKVFSGDNTYERQFNTTGQTATATDCNSQGGGWSLDCNFSPGTLQIHCADSSKTTGAVHDLQTKLNQLSCGTNTLAVDGCFGPLTMNAVRRFQVANDLLPTGQVDSNTQNKINSVGAVSCTAQLTLVNGVTGVLPATQDSSASLSSSGCCVVKKGAIALYCADQVSARTCEANGGTYYDGVANCTSDPQTKDTCGYCYNSNVTSGGSPDCFQTTTNFWCTQVVQPPMSFQAGLTCYGQQPDNRCSNSCKSELLNITP